MTGRARRRVALLPFALSAVLVPLVVALPAIALILFGTDATPRPLLQIGIVSFGAVFAGAVPYVILGLPAFYHFLRHRDADAHDMAITGFIVNLASPVPMLIVGAVMGDIDGPGAVYQDFALYWTFGSVFAPLCGALFALFYRHLARIVVAASGPSGPPG